MAVLPAVNLRGRDMLRSHRTCDLAFNLKIADCAHEILAREKRATPSFRRWYGKTDKRIGFSSFALLPILIPFVHALVLLYHIFYI